MWVGLAGDRVFITFLAIASIEDSELANFSSLGFPFIFSTPRATVGSSTNL